MIIYTVVILISVLLTEMYKLEKFKKLRTLLIILIILVPSLVAAFRGGSVGADTNAYIDYFYLVGSTPGNLFTYSMEPLYNLLNKLSYLIIPHHSTMLFINSILIMSLIFTTFTKYSKNLSLSILLFYSTYIYYESLNGMRQYIAIALVFFSIRYIFDRKMIKYLIFILLASGFHTTSILMLPLYVLYPLVDRGSKMKLFYWVSIALVSYLFLPQILNIIVSLLPRYSNYINNIDSSSGGVRSIFISVFLIGLGFFTIYVSKTKPNQRLWFYLLMIIFYFASSLYVLEINSNLAQRLGWYFTIFIPLFIPELLKLISNNKTRSIITFLVVISYLALHYYLLFFNSHQVLPYILDI